MQYPKVHMIVRSVCFRRYQLFTQIVTQPDASQLCSSRGGRLAEVHNQQQFEAVQTFSSQSGRFWLGGTVPLQDGVFIWPSDGSLISYNVFWAPSEPNNAATFEFCMIFSNFGTVDGFNDVSCARLFSTLCELEGSGDTPVCP